MEDNIVIVIPCYNEYNRLPVNDYKLFIQKHKNCTFVFSDDGSVDNTVLKLQEIKAVAEDRVHIFEAEKNGGKAMAVRNGVLYAYDKKLEFDKIAFLDSDLATSLQECLKISKRVKKKVVMAIGSRIQKIDNKIDRKLYRHLIGRVIATVISIILNLRVYDTQCGCKVFSRDLGSYVFRDKFISKWLFDVEIFFRVKQLYKRKQLAKIVKEVPLKKWVDKDDSKVKFSYSLKVWFDLYKIRKAYRKQELNKKKFTNPVYPVSSDKPYWLVKKSRA